MEKLKPCPFCGEKNELYLKSFSGWVADAIVCYGCHAIFSQQEITREEDLIEAWTRRATEVPDKPWIPFTVRDLDEEEKELHPEWDFILDGKLPENGQRILVNVKYRGHEAVQMDEYYDDDGCYLDSGYDIGMEVTHWMPLPEPPKEGSES